MTEPRDFYEVLGVPRDADASVIKDAFRQLALKFHPDRNKDPGASDRFKEIAEAYAVLSDPAKRAEYDARGHAGIAGFSPEDLFAGINFGDIFGDLGIGFGGSRPFEGLFGRHKASERGQDLEVSVVVPLERVVTGGEEVVHVGRPARCESCQGTGAKAGTKPRSCAQCGGTGQLVRNQRTRGVRVQQIRTCPACAGRGTIIDTPCPECNGQGQTLREEALTVRIPVGVEEGTALRVPAHGLPASKPGLPSGDLFVVVRAAPDPRFERRGRDLYRIETIDIVDAVLGTEINVPTLDGPVSATVPAGTQPDSLLRLREKGLPSFGGGPRGDLYLQLQVHVPAHLTEQQRQLFEKLRAARAPKARSKV